MPIHSYDTKLENYFTNVRLDLLNLIPEKNRLGTLLEIGAGSGNTLLFAKANGFAIKTVGIEICDINDSQQHNPDIDRFIIGNIEELILDFDENYFDVIICGDVLEHLINPHNIVSILKKYLKRNGVLITSIPNIRNWRVMKDIFFKGDFHYTENGILDSTHLRFFCKKNIENLFLDNNLTIIGNVSNIHLIGGKTQLFNKLTFQIFEEFLATQYHTISQRT